MSSRINWRKFNKKLEMSPADWLAQEYCHAPNNRDLAKRILAITGWDIEVDAMLNRMKQKATIMGLNKTGEALRQCYDEAAEKRSLPDRPALIRFDDWMEKEADPVAITCDWHVPYWNERLARRLLLLCQHWNPPVKSLVIGGDFIDVEQLSTFVPERDGDGIDRSLEDDLADAERMLRALADWFDDVWCIKGNHENRLHSKKLAQQIGYKRLSRLWNIVPEKIEFSKWTWMVITDSEGQKWRVTHKGRWKVPGRLAQELAEKYHMNLIATHSHVMSLTYSLGGHYTCIDAGGMCEPSLMGYYVIEDDPNPVWCPGFVIISDGKPHLFNDKWTDWHFYRERLGIPLGWREE